MEESFPLGEIREKKNNNFLTQSRFQEKQLGVTFHNEIKKKKKNFFVKEGGGGTSPTPPPHRMGGGSWLQP